MASKQSIKRDNVTRRVNLYLQFAALFAMSILFVGMISYYPVDIFNFRYNTFALISALSVIGNVIVLYLINRSEIRTPETPWFSLFTATSLFWVVGEMCQRFSATPGTAVFWIEISTIGWFFLPLFLTGFVLVYLDKEALLKHSTTLLAMFSFSALGFYIAHNGTNLIYNFDPAKAILLNTGYYDILPGPYFLVFLLYFFFMFIALDVLLIRAYKRTVNMLQKKQLLLFIVGLSLLLTLSSLFDGILPIFGIVLPTVFGLMTSVLCLFLMYGIFRYGLFSFNPVTLASSILQNMNEAVIGIDTAYRVQFVNKTAEIMLGYDQLDISNRSIKDLLTQQNFEQFDQQIIKPLSNENMTLLEDIVLRTANKNTVPVSITANKIFDERDQLKGYILIVTNISALKESYHKLQQKSIELEHAKASVEQKVKLRTSELEEKRAQLLASINSLNFGFVLTDSHAHILMLNSSAEEILNDSESKDRHFTIDRIEEKLGKSIKLHEKITECISQKKTLQISEIAAGTRFLRIVLSPIMLKSGVIGAVIILEDITEDKIAQRSKDEFFTIASHELRTPLTIIRGYVDLIQESYIRKIHDQEFTKMVGYIERSSSLLIKIVNDFLDMSSLEQGKMLFSIQSVDVSELAEDLAQEFHQIAQEKNITVEYKTEAKHALRAQADPVRLRQIITNLVGNAVKFTDQGKVTVLTEESEEKILISVHDTGKGIPASNQSLLFRKFQQAGSSLYTRDSVQGTGLGLYISKMMAKSMKGDVVLKKSNPSDGTTFEVTLQKSTPSSHKK